ncbi:hypothetical protein C2E23DRAFT_803372 [Lenzites betulinus]|nr:hypothetical protein C2E23DRAFT_803372 [Lenzites betulinus]
MRSPDGMPRQKGSPPTSNAPRGILVIRLASLSRLPVAGRKAISKVVRLRRMEQQPYERTAAVR